MRRAVLAGAVVLLLAATAGAASVADPGLTPTTIVLGGTVPLSGEAAAFGSVGPGAKAYFAYVNAKGGVNGRKIDYRYLDDGYDPAQTVQLTRQLVEQDRVFAVFNSIGTNNNLAIRPYLSAQKVPQLFVGDGSDALAQPRKYPGTMGLLPSYRGEGAVYGRTLATTRPKARIAVLFENNDLGKDMTRGLSRAIAGKGPRIVASEPYEYTDPDVSSQIAKLNWYGMTAAWTMVETLRRAGRNLTRAGLVKTAQNLDLRNNPFLLPGITIRTSPTKYFPIANIYLYRYDNKEWVRASPLQPAR